MQTRNESLGCSTIHLSVSLYGSHNLYIAGAYNIIKRMESVKRNYMKFVLHIHHDNSVPLFHLNEFKKCPSVFLHDQTYLNLKDHERMFWRFFTAAETDICVILDLDEDPLTFLMESESFWFRTSIMNKQNNKSVILTHIPYWTNESNLEKSKILIPGSLAFFINFHLDPYGKHLKTHIINFLRETQFKYKNHKIRKYETNAERGVTYGLDEYFLTHVMIPELSITHIFRSNICRQNHYKSYDLFWDDHIDPALTTI